MSAVKAVLLIGSPRGDGSASKALGERLLKPLAGRGAVVEAYSLHAAHGSEPKTEAWLAAADGADILVFAFPLYVDQLPAPVILALDRLAARCRATGAKAGALLTALVQCGFPEPGQNQPALSIMERFARTNGFVWAGGMAMGMGGAIVGRPMPEKPAGMLHNVLRGLDQAAAALVEGRPIPEESIARIGTRLMPRKLYFLAANWGWRAQARKNAKKAGRKIDLLARPY
jgi:multimeric flavodoxin WrbA